MPKSKKFNTALLLSFIICCGFGWSENYAPVTKLPHKQKVVALTFDDGPKNGPSEALFALLEKEEIKATFFVNGKSVKNDPDLLYRMLKSGHDIGNHTYFHKRLDVLTRAEIKAELLLNNEALSKITKKPIKFFRAPGGRYNKDVYAAAAELKLKVINWSVNPGDYLMDEPVFESGEALFVRSAEMIESEVLRKIKPGDIILMHTGNYESIEALKTIIPALKKQGYRFVKISEFY